MPKRKACRQRNQKWRIRKAFENGELVNLRFLFGYNITASGIQVNEREAAIVREIFTRFNGGESLSAISRDLNDRGCERTLWWNVVRGPHSEPLVQRKVHRQCAAPEAVPEESH